MNEEYEKLKLENERLRELLLKCYYTFEVVVDGYREIEQSELKDELRKELSIID